MSHIICLSSWWYFFNNFKYTLPTGMLPRELQVVKLIYYVLFPSVITIVSQRTDHFCVILYPSSSLSHMNTIWEVACLMSPFSWEIMVNCTRADLSRSCHLIYTYGKVPAHWASSVMCEQRHKIRGKLSLRSLVRQMFMVCSRLRNA